METMIDRDKLKALRTKRSWTQELLGEAAGLSLRTVHRIENEGRCSPESKKAIAAALDISEVDLDIDYELVAKLSGNARGAKWGIGGALVGMICAYVGVSLGWANGQMDAGQAGTYYGVIGAFCGFTCALIGTGSHLYKKRLESERVL